VPARNPPFPQCEVLVFGIKDFAKEDRNGAAQPIDGARFGFKPKSSSRTGVFFRLKNDLQASGLSGLKSSGFMVCF
jgi:hypothetical protein